MLLELAVISSIQLGSGEGFRVREWGGFSRWSLPSNSTTWVLEISPSSDSHEPQPEWWVLERHQTPLLQFSHKPQEAWSWADSRTCPQMMAVLKTLSNLEIPRITPPGVVSTPKPVEVIDGDDYRIWFKAIYPSGFYSGRGEVGGSNGSPVAKWVDDAEQSLNSCWSSMPPAHILQNGQR